MAADSDTVIAGVPLAQFAAVTAALAEGFPLRAVLSVEGLDAARWAEADRGWTERLDRDPTLLARYQTDLAVAQDRLLSRDEHPADEGAPAKPPLRAGKARLVRSGTGIAPVIAPPTAASLAAPTQAPSYLAPTEAGLGPPAPRGPSYLASSESATSAPIPKGPSYLTPPDPVAMGPTGPRAPSYLAAPEPAPVPVPVPVPVPALPPAPSFTLPPETAPPVPVPFPIGRDLTSTFGDDDGTRVGYQRPEVFPFRASPSSPAPAIGAPAGTPARRTVAAAHAETEVLPFRARDHADDASNPHLEEETRVGAPVVGSALPFKPASAREHVEPPARTTTLAGDGSDGMTVTVGGDVAAALRALEIPAFVPPPAVASTPTSAEPPMSLERHASLCLELAVDPAHAGEALARYQVTPAEKARADEYYRALIASDPERRAQWNHAYTVYHQWFTSRPRP